MVAVVAVAVVAVAMVAVAMAVAVGEEGSARSRSIWRNWRLSKPRRLRGSGDGDGDVVMDEADTGDAQTDVADATVSGLEAM